MKDTLKPGLEYEFTYTVTENKTVPALYPEAEEFLVMPNVFATGYLVGLLEWACIKALKPHLDWPDEQTVGTSVDLKHMAATPPGLTVRVNVKLIALDGRKLTFHLEAHDGIDKIAECSHERFVINAEKFGNQIAKKIP